MSSENQVQRSKKTYFKDPYSYIFQDPVKLKMSKYNMLLTQISERDQASINEIFSKIGITSKIKDSVYMDSKKKYENKCMITIEITGQRRLGEIIKPIWQIKSANRCIQEVILCEDNMLDIDIDSRKPKDYYQYKMHLFFKQLIYKFQDLVKVKKCPYNLEMSEISSVDLNILNNLFPRIDESFRITESAFINSNETDENTYSNMDKRYLIAVEIKGFKIHDDKFSPIWKIKTIYNVY